MQGKNCVYKFTFFTLMFFFILSFTYADEIQLKKEILGLTDDINIIYDGKILKQDESEIDKLADLFFEKAEILYIKMQVSDKLSNQLKNEYKNSLKKSIYFYELNKKDTLKLISESKLRLFELLGEPTKLDSGDLLKLKEKLNEKFSLLNEKTGKKIVKKTNELLNLQNDSNVILKNDTSIVKTTKPVSLKKIVETKSLSNNKTVLKSFQNKLSEFEDGLRVPEFSIYEKNKLSPVIHQIKLNEQLKKEYEEVKEEGLLGWRNKQFGKTKLSIRGQKTIKFDFKRRSYSGDESDDNGSNDFNIEQTLEVNVSGQVGDNVKVNVDYNDQRESDNKQQLSIEYQSDEHILSPRTKSNILSGYAAFGDIELKLGNTQLISYNRKLFGIKGGIKIKDLNYSIFKAEEFKFDIIASRTKGEPGHREFSGQSSPQVITDVYDVDFIKNSYFYVVSDIGNDTDIKRNTLKVYLDDKTSSNDKYGVIDTGAYEVSPTDPNVKVISRNNNGEIEEFHFKPLVENTDYIYEPEKNRLRVYSTSNRDAIAVSYETNRGYKILYKLIKKDEDSRYSDTFAVYEIKNTYSLHINDIREDDPDFRFEIQDKNNNYSTGIDADSDGKIEHTFLELFGLDRKGKGSDGVLGTPDDVNEPDGFIDDDFIDYEKGLVEFPEKRPFEIARDISGLTYSKYSRPEIYNQENPDRRFRIYVQAKAKADQFFLQDFDLVRNSETVKVDGKTLKRNVDYYIDYSTGFLVFLDPSIITKDSKVIIDYEKIPFGSSANKTLLGTRLEAKINSNLKLGTTMIYNTNDKSDEIPEIGMTPQRTNVSGADFEFKPLNLSIDFFNFIFRKKINYISPEWIDIKIVNEFANSEFEPNIYGKAMIDDMESSDDSLGVSLNYKSWLINDMTNEHTTLLPSEKKGFVTFDETDYSDNIGHKSELRDDEDNQKSMIIEYTLDSGDTWFAIRNILARDGVDISKKNYLEFWVKGSDDFNINIDFGTISEDADGDGALDQEDGLFINGIKTGKDPDGKLSKNPTEDVGLTYNTPDGDTVYIGADDDFLTTEDLDGDEKLDLSEKFFRYANVNENSFVKNGEHIDEDRTDWKFYRVNLWDANFYEKITKGYDIDADSKLIKHFRIWFSKKTSNDTKTTGKIYVDNISFTGSTWQEPDLTDENFVVLSKNNIDDDYNVFNYEVGMKSDDSDDNEGIKEQSLYFSYKNLTDSDYMNSNYKYYAERDFGLKNIDITKYEFIKFYVKKTEPFGGDGGETVFIRIGDVNNYFEYTFPAPAASNLKTDDDWTEITIPINFLMEENDTVNMLINTNNIDTSYTFGENNEYRVKFSNSRPNLYNVNIIRLGIVGINDGVGATGNLFVNTLLVDGVKKEKGFARITRIQSKFLKDIFTLNYEKEKRTSTFQTVDEIKSTITQGFVPEETTRKKYDGTFNVGKMIDEVFKLKIDRFNVSGSYEKSTVSVEPDFSGEVERSKLGDTVKKNKQISSQLQHSNLNIDIRYTDNEEDKDYRDDNYLYIDKDFKSSVNYSVNIKEKLFGNTIFLKKIPVLRSIPVGKSLKMDFNYNYEYSIDDRDYREDTNKEDSYDKYTTDFKKIGITSNPFDWITIQPDFSITEKYHKNRTQNGKDNEIINTNWKIDIKRMAGFQPTFNYGYNKDLDYDITSDSDPIENLKLTGSIKLDVYPVDWYKKFDFLDGRIDISGNFNEQLNSKEVIKNKDTNIDGKFNVNINLRPNKVWKNFDYFDLHYEYSNSASAQYDEISPDYSFTDIYNDYLKEFLFPWQDKNRVIIDTDTLSDSLIDRRSSAKTEQTHSFSGKIFIWSPLDLRYNYKKTSSITQTWTSDNFSNAYSAQLNSRLNFKDFLKKFKFNRAIRKDPEMKNLKKELKKLRKKYNKISKNVVKMETKIFSLETKIKNFSNEIQKLNEEYLEYEKKNVSSKNKKYKKLLLKIASKKRDKNDKKEKLLDEKKFLVSKKTELKNIESELSKKINENEKILNKLDKPFEYPRPSLNMNYTFNKDESGNYIDNNNIKYTHSRNMSLEIIWSKKFNTTFTMDFPYEKNYTQNESGKTVERKKSLTPKITWNYLMESPFKFYKPFTKKMYKFENKLNLNGTLHYTKQSTELTKITDEVETTEDLNSYGFTVGAKYDLSNFFRIAADAGYTKNTNNVDDGEDWTEYSVSANVTIVF